MNRPMMVLLASALFLLPTARGQEPDTSNELAIRLARQITEKGAARYDAPDAAALAISYTEDAEVALMLKGKEGYEVKPYKSRDEIEKLYRDLFKGDEEIWSRNVVEGAHLLQPDLLVIYGTFEVRKGKETSRFPFFQIRVKSGEDWLMSSLRLFVVPSGS